MKIKYERIDNIFKFLIIAILLSFMLNYDVKKNIKIYNLFT